VATVGDIDANVAKMTQGERRIPIRVRLPAETRADLDALGALRVPTAGGGATRLDTVADLSFQAGPAKIDRFARKRQVTIEADLNNGAQLGQAMSDVGSLPTMKQLPPSVGPATAGDQEAFVELFTGFAIALLSAVGLVFGVLVLLFRSFFKPITILSALPLAIGGAFLALLVTGQSLSMPSLIGFLMLMGLAAKNSILLVEYAIEQERAGMSQREAIIDACHERARPIVMTTLAMMAGMLPTALGIGTGSEFRQPMAVAVIGGLITSTVLSLVLVPVVYEIVDDVERWLTPKLSRMTTPREVDQGTERLPPSPVDRLSRDAGEKAGSTLSSFRGGEAYGGALLGPGYRLPLVQQRAHRRGVRGLGADGLAPGEAVVAAVAAAAGQARSRTSAGPGRRRPG
jgi:HAE1 family hydrophobic/amphiphilic exporter-1